MDDGDAFFPDPEGGPARSRDELADTLAEEYLDSATSGEEAGERVRDQVVPEELGGPFLQSTADEELVDDVDPNNPPGAEAEPFPRAVGGR
jgi:hypothetical protein